MKIFDKFLDWVTTPAVRAGNHGMAQALGHRDPRDGCLPRLQGIFATSFRLRH